MTQELQKPLPEVLAEIVAIWILSDIGYVLLVSLLGAGSGYSNAPFLMAAYYLFWVGITFFTFWSLYRTWQAIEMRASLLWMVAMGGIGVGLYLLYVLPLFPAIQWGAALRPAPELLSASQWYFLPKSIDIALQQLLVLAMVLGFSVRGFSLKEIRWWSAALFGSIHLLLVFGGGSLAYVAVFTLSATLAGFIFPYLMLKVRNGFVYSYLLHWGFYAFVIVLTRLMFAGRI